MTYDRELLCSMLHEVEKAMDPSELAMLDQRVASLRARLEDAGLANRRDAGEAILALADFLACDLDGGEISTATLAGMVATLGWRIQASS